MTQNIAISWFAATNTIQSAIIEAEKKVNSTINNSEIIISKIDTFVWKLSSEKRAELIQKIVQFEKKINSKSTLTTKEENILIILTLVRLKIEEKNLWNLVIPTKTLINEYNNELTSKENQEFNNQIISIQKNLLKSWVDSLEYLLWEFEEYTNTEDTGDFSINLDVDHELIGKIKAQFALEEYTSTTSWFDTQLQGNLKAMVDAAPNWEEALKFEIKSFIDFISKDQNMYLLMNKFSISNEEWTQEIKAFIEKAREIAEKNKYIQLTQEDADIEAAILLLKSISPQNILSQWNEVLSKPMFRSYKKIGSKYYIVPTKYACDTMKELSNKFDPFHGPECSDSQYNDVLEDIAKSNIQMYLEVGSKTNTLWLEVTDSENTAMIEFWNNYIEKISVNIIENQETMSLAYIRNESFKYNVNANYWELLINIDSILTKQNKISMLDFSVISNDFNSKITLKNNIITGNYNIEWYNDKTVGVISGSTNNDDTLKQLEISNQIVDTWSYSPFENLTVMTYDMWEYGITNYYLGEYTQSNFEVKWKWNTNENMLEEASIEFIIKQKESSFNYETYEMTYSDTFNEVFNHSSSLYNEKIIWETIISSNREEVLSIEHSWAYKKGIFEFNNKIETGPIPFALWSTWDSIIWNINIKTDTTWTNNNANIYIDLSLNTDKIFELEVNNTSNRTYKSVNIQKPLDKQIIPLDEVIDNPIY